MMNLWLVLLAEYHLVYHDHIFFSSCALSFWLPCFGSSNFWKFIFHVLDVLGSLTIVLSQIFQERATEFWKSIENWLSYLYELGVVLFWNTVYVITVQFWWTHSERLGQWSDAVDTDWYGSKLYGSLTQADCDRSVQYSYIISVPFVEAECKLFNWVP